MSPLWHKPGTTREQIEGDYRERLDTLTEVKASKPWYRRAWSWAQDAHKVLVGVAAMCTTTIAIHAWMAGLVTKDNVKTEVRQAVAEALLEMHGRVSDLEQHTSGIVDWRQKTNEQIARHEERINATQKLSERTENRVDRYLGRR